MREKKPSTDPEKTKFVFKRDSYTYVVHKYKHKDDMNISI